MILVTSQPIDFDITKDELDLSKSSNLSDHFDQDKIFNKAYKWLFNKLGHDEFIWCYINGERNFMNHGDEYVLWTLDVPDDQCILINAHTWNCVINNWAYIDEDLISKDITDDDYEKLTDSYKGREEQTWNDNIFKNEKERMEILIKSPVIEKFVIDKKWSCDYDLTVFDKISDGMINNFHRNEESLNKNLEIYESGLKGRKINYLTEIKKHQDGCSLKIEW